MIIWGMPLVGAPAGLHQLHHPGHHHRRGHRRQHGPHDGGFHPADAQNDRSQQDKGQDLTAGGHTAEHGRRAAHCPQLGEVQGQARLQQNDDEGDLPQVGGHRQQVRVQSVQGAGTQQDARQQHADDPGAVRSGGHSAAAARPTRKMSARDVTIEFPPLRRKKPDAFCDEIITEVISFKSGSGAGRPAAGELHSRCVLYAGKTASSRAQKNFGVMAQMDTQSSSWVLRYRWGWLLEK